MTQLPNNFFAVQVPDGFLKREILNCLGGQRVKTSDRVGDYTYSEPLPPGSWQIVSLASEITEEQAGEIVKSAIKPRTLRIVYADYEQPPCEFSTALESFHSLLKYHSLNEVTTLIIKQVK